MTKPRRRDFRTRLDLQTLQGSTTPDARGHSQKAFATVIEGLYGAMRQLKGEEAILARQINPVITHEIEMDHRTEIVEEARFLVAGSTSQVLNVISIDNVEDRDRTMRVMVGEVK